MWCPEKCPTKQVDPASKLWRYIDLTRLLALCAERRLHFAPASSFADAKEGQLLDDEREAALRGLRIRAAGAPADQHGDISARLAAYLDRASDRTCISSWTLADEESWLHWNRFGLSNTVAIQTTVEALRAQLMACPHEVVPGPVEYTDGGSAALTADDVARFFRKRRCFREEHEYRLLVVDRPPEFEEQTPRRHRGLFVDVELSATLAQVVVSPATPGWGERAITATLRALGYDGPVVRSATV